MYQKKLLFKQFLFPLDNTSKLTRIFTATVNSAFDKFIL